AGAVMIYSFVLSFAIGWAIKKTMGFRVSTQDEIEGIDVSQHAESAYEYGGVGVAGSFQPLHDQIQHAFHKKDTHAADESAGRIQP
ncbi:MAG TPA: ammonia channel protein, partial [Arthrobacter bacterium]|nr:ammonia channel protein [Arthrobacter sp.]